MKIVVCLDDKNGMLFNKRRQSKDRVLRERLLELVGGGRLWINAYSAGQFTEGTECICVDEDFLSKAEAGDFCFVENMDVARFSDKIESVVIYRWNRSYPSDVKFPVALFEQGWQRVSCTDFAGSSHEKITEEVYVL